MAPLFKVRAPVSGGSSSTNRIDLTGYGSADISPSFSHDFTEKFGKIRHKKRLNVRHLPFVIVGLVLFIMYSMHSAKYRSGSVIKDVSNNHAFGMQLTPATHVVATEEVEDEQQLAAKVAALDQKVREYRPAKGMFMENDPKALELTGELQHWTKALVLSRYGNHRSFRVALDLEFPPSIPDYDKTSPSKNTGRVVFEMAPLDLLPCSVYYFLEIARTFQKSEGGGNSAFIRNADHVLQASVTSSVRQSMPFQEYSQDFAHFKGTTGYAGRPSGPQFYISIMDNSRAHGRGSQQKQNPYEADSNFGRVVQGMEDVVPRIHSVPQKEFLDRPNYTKITSMTILYGDSADGEFKEWNDESSSSTARAS